ncbi:MAG TPA: DUF1802 family protein [Gemmataceae bacterium]|nr:DUF1802 family protein [Gemmataceae bacterium]
MLKHAFKEWAVICRALAEGRQAIILRKGGVAEDGGSFEVAQKRFWLFPTYLHQKPEALKPEALRLLHAVEADRPPAGTVRLSHFAEVGGVYHLHDVVGALKIDPLHLWSRDTVAARFEYRTPGLFVLPVRVFRVPEVPEIADAPRYAGCKSWVELERELPTEGASPVLDDDAFRDVTRTLDLLLQPTAII